MSVFVTTLCHSDFLYSKTLFFFDCLNIKSKYYILKLSIAVVERVSVFPL